MAFLHSLTRKGSEVQTLYRAPFYQPLILVRLTDDTVNICGAPLVETSVSRAHRCRDWRDANDYEDDRTGAAASAPAALRFPFRSLATSSIQSLPGRA